MNAERERLRCGRAALLALLLGLLLVGRALLPGHALLPLDPRVHEPRRTLELDPEQRKRVELEAVVHGGDALQQFLPFDRAAAAAWRAGEPPLWHPGLLCGLPLLAQGSSRAFYPTAAAFLLADPAPLYGWIWLAHLVLGGLFGYRLARRLGASEHGAVLACATLVLSGFVCARVHHPMVFFAALWILPALEASDALLRPRGARPSPAAPLALAGSVALSWLAGFPQASVLLCYTVGGYGIWCLLGERRARRRPCAAGVLLWALSLAAGLLLAAVQIVPMAEMALHSARPASDPAAAGANGLPLASLLELLLPGQLAPPGEILTLDGFERRPSFLALWLLSRERALAAAGGGVLNHAEFAFGIGIWPLIFALRAVAGPGRAARLYLSIAAAFGLLGAFAFTGLPGLLHFLPGLGIGDPKRLLALPAMALPILAGLGYTAPSRRWSATALLLCLVPAAAGAAVLLADENTFIRFFGERIAPRFGATADAFLAAVGEGEAHRNRLWLGAGLFLLAASLALGGASAWLPRMNPWLLVAATALAQAPLAWDGTPAPEYSVEREQGPPGGAWRRFVRLEPLPPGMPWNPGYVRFQPPNTTRFEDACDAGGYAPLPPAGIERFFGTIDAASPSRGAGVACLREPGLFEAPSPVRLLRLAGVRRVESSVPLAVPGLLAPHPSAEAVLAAGLHRYLLAGPETPLRLFEDSECSRETPPEALRLESLEWPSRAGRGRIAAGVAADRPGWLFVPMGWMPGWRYRIDGGPWRPTAAALEAFQALPVPSGSHLVELVYAPDSFILGLLGSSLGLLASALLLTLSVSSRPAPRADMFPGRGGP